MLASDQELEEAGNRLGERLLTTGRTVATAESCTGEIGRASCRERV